MIWVMTDSVSSRCCFSYWNKWEEKRAEIETNGREISTKCQGEGFIFISPPSFIQRISSLCHQDPDQTHGIAMLRSWRSWHDVLNTCHYFPRAFLFIPYLTGEQADTVHGLPRQWGSTKGSLREAAQSLGMPAQHSHLENEVKFDLCCNHWLNFPWFLKDWGFTLAMLHFLGWCSFQRGYAFICHSHLHSLGRDLTAAARVLSYCTSTWNIKIWPGER